MYLPRQVRTLERVGGQEGEEISWQFYSPVGSVLAFSTVRPKMPLICDVLSFEHY